MLTRNPMDQAVRTVERCGLLAAVTGIVSNGLLLAGLKTRAPELSTVV